MKKSKIIFLVVFVLFTLAMIAFTFHMASKTTAPWEKKKKKADTTEFGIR